MAKFSLVDSPNSFSTAPNHGEFDDQNESSGQKFSLVDTPRANPEPAPHKSPLSAVRPKKTADGSSASSRPMAWGDVASGFVNNFIPDVTEQVGSLYHAVTNPTETLGAMKQLGKGAYSQLKGAIGVEQDKDQKASDEALIRQIEEGYKQKYGTLEGFKEGLATHPAAFLTDLSTFMGGAGAGLKAAGAAGKIGALTKAGQIASAASVLDPITGAVKLAGKVATAPVSIARKSAELASGVPVGMQETASKVGSSWGKGSGAAREAYNKFKSGQGEPVEYLQAAQKALNQARAEDVANYVKKKGTITGTPSYDPIDQAVADARAQTRQFQGSAEFDRANAALDEVQDLVNGRRFSADPNAHSMEGFNTLKQAIWDLKDKHPNAVADRHLSGIYNAIKKSLVDANPEYAALMDQYVYANNGIKDAQKALSIGDNAGATAALMKGIKASKSAAGQNMIDKLAKYEPTLPAMLAGHAASPATGGWARYGADLGLSYLAGSYLHPATALIPALAGSPKVVGAANYYGGMLASPAINAAKLVDKIPAKSKTAYYAGAIGQEGLPNKPEQPPEQKPSDDRYLGEFGEYEDSSEDEGAAKTNNFDQSFDWLIKHEGTKYITDSNGYGAKFGINEKANPDVDVKNLTIDQAKSIYKKKYWDAVDGDNLSAINPKLALAAFDLAALAGPSVAKRITAQSNGDLNKFMELRQSFLNSIKSEKLNKGSANVDAIHDAWANRGKDILTSASGGRIERASGGKVGNAKHERIVNKLMAMASKAKKVTDRTTESLLDEPDESIVKALNVAQQAI